VTLKCARSQAVAPHLPNSAAEYFVRSNHGPAFRGCHVFISIETKGGGYTPTAGFSYTCGMCRIFDQQ